MAVEWKKWGRNISLFLFSRYPIVNGLSFLMLLGERAKRETQPPLDPNVIYGHIGVFIGAGLAMGFNFRRKAAALVHVVQLFYLAFSIQYNAELKYKDWLRIKMCLRLLGVAGFFLLYAFFTCRKPRPQYLRRLGETIIGLYFAFYLYQLLQEPVEKEAFLKHAFGGMVSLYITALLLATIALCYIPGLFVNDITQAVVLILWFTTTSVDCRMHYWTKRMGVDYWNQVRLIMDHVAMMLGCVMYITCTKKVTYEHYGPDGSGDATPADASVDDGVDVVEDDIVQEANSSDSKENKKDQ